MCVCILARNVYINPLCVCVYVCARVCVYGREDEEKEDEEEEEGNELGTWNADKRQHSSIRGPWLPLQI